MQCGFNGTSVSFYQTGHSTYGNEDCGPEPLGGLGGGGPAISTGSAIIDDEFEQWKAVREVVEQLAIDYTAIVHLYLQNIDDQQRH